MERGLLWEIRRAMEIIPKAMFSLKKSKKLLLGNLTHTHKGRTHGNT
jgi:hypothetical protein